MGNVQVPLTLKIPVFFLPNFAIFDINIELAIHALDQVPCWGTYFRPGIGHYENFTSLNFQPLLFSKQ
jgi:hypothetical protein